MSDYRHILLAIDYSAHSDYVANKAKALADRYQAKFSIIHVLDNIPMPDTNYGSVIPINEDTGYELLEIEKNKLIIDLPNYVNDITNNNVKTITFSKQDNQYWLSLVYQEKSKIINLDKDNYLSIFPEIVKMQTLTYVILLISA